MRAKNPDTALRNKIKKILKDSNKYSDVLDPMIDGYVQVAKVRDRLAKDIEEYGAVIPTSDGNFRANPAITGYNNAAKEARQALMSLGMDCKGIDETDGDPIDILTQRLQDIN